MNAIISKINENRILILSEMSRLAKGEKMPQIVLGVINQKGGTGKTTAANGLAYEFAEKQKLKTLVIDFDPQASMTVVFFNLNQNSFKDGEHDVASIFDRKTVNPIKLRENLDLIPGNIGLANKVELAITGKDIKLRNFIMNHCKEYDVIVIDTNPSFSTLMTNVILASNVLLMPVGTSSLDEAGSKDYMQILSNTYEDYEGYLADAFFILPTKFDKRRKDDKEVLSILQNETISYMKSNSMLSKIRVINTLEPIPEKSVAKDAAACRMFPQEYIEKYSRQQREFSMVFERVAKAIVNKLK